MYPDPTIRLRIPTINSVIIINKYNKSRVHNSTKDPKKNNNYKFIIINTINISAPDPHIYRLRILK